ncbi:MAG TPA: DoxX family protein [Gemmatimonadales bacterium]|jgi:putative oxidoreductase
MMSRDFISGGRTDLALLILRLVTGFAFAFHGWQKVAQMGMPAMVGFFGKVGVPLPGVLAPVVSYVELIGGILLMAGFFFRYLPRLFVIDMAGAIFFVHGKNGYSMEHMGFEYVLALLAMSAALSLLGPGALSIDGMLRKRQATRT